ncbi:MAG: hypothetical protein KAS32_01300 [Candidatus Peribacteraceae bacterium]|nr:hypothetical protein [Candidatus Peribacteraceae bacterium]
MIQFDLEIRPAIPVELRHQIAKLIEQHGYNVWSQGQRTDNSICDINFETKKEKKNEETD